MPHAIRPADSRKKVVVIGAGPGGMEAARVAAARGHSVMVFEAGPEAGGQVRLASQDPRRREMISIIEWRVEECARAGVDFRFNTWAEACDVLLENPDVVIVATGGWPHTEVLQSGNDLVISTWDILSGDVRSGSNVLIYDDAGDHAGLQAAVKVAESGAKVEIMTPDRTFAPEVMGMNLVPYMRALQAKDVTFTVTFRLMSVRSDDSGKDELLAVVGSDYSDLRQERSFDQVVVNHGTTPMDDLYFELKAASMNLGEVDHGALIEGRPQTINGNPDGKFKLFRIGDAVSARNTHAAIYDALRLMKDV